MWQLNLAMSEDEAVQIVDLYDTTGKGEMRYDQLVKDITAGVPHFTKQYNDAATLAKCARGVWKWCGAFTSLIRLVAISRGRGWFIFRV